MSAPITKEQMLIDFSTKSIQDLQKKYNLSSDEINAIRGLQGRELEERVSKIILGGGHCIT